MVVDQNAEPPVGSIDKALALLELLAEAGPDGMALRDVVETSGLNKASAHRTLQALQHRGFAEQDTNQRYRLGSRPALLVERFLREENLPTLFRPTLLAICQEVQELVHLGILEGRNVLYLDKVEPDRTLRVWSRVGRQVSVLTTALGRAMVAGEGTPDSLLSASRPTPTPRWQRDFAGQSARHNSTDSLQNVRRTRPGSAVWASR